MSDPIPLPPTEPGPRPDRCETCRYRWSRLILDADGKWKPNFLPDGQTEAEFEDSEPSAECRRFPPEFAEGPSGEQSREFPGVYLNDGCGEWQPNHPIQKTDPKRFMYEVELDGRAVRFSAPTEAELLELIRKHEQRDGTT